MALTDLQKPTLEDFYNNVKDGAGSLYRLAKQFKSHQEFLARMDTAALDDLAVPIGDIRVDLVDYRDLLGELVDFFANVPVNPANDPITVLNKIRRMNVL